MKNKSLFFNSLCVLILGVMLAGPSCVSRGASEKTKERHPNSIGATTDSESEFSPNETQKNPLRDLNFKNHLQHDQVFFDWPVDRARLTRGFLPKKRKPHLGIDLASARGTPVFSAAQGRVVYAGRDFRGYGRMVLIESKNEWATLYAHLDKIYVNEGQSVQIGETIGSMGRTGRATGTHLHFELRKNKAPVNPLVYLPSSRSESQKVSKH